MKLEITADAITGERDGLTFSVTDSAQVSFLKEVAMRSILQALPDAKDIMHKRAEYDRYERERAKGEDKYPADVAQVATLGGLARGFR